MSPVGWSVVAGAVFAALWGLWGAGALTGPWRRRVILPVLMASVGIAARAATGGTVLRGAVPRFDDVPYIAAVAFAVLGLTLVFLALRSPMLRGWRAPAAAAVVGLHFLGLWAATGLRLFIGVALGMTASALIAAGWPQTAAGVDSRRAITGLGSAVVLWCACLASLA